MTIMDNLSPVAMSTGFALMLFSPAFPAILAAESASGRVPLLFASADEQALSCEQDGHGGPGPEPTDWHEAASFPGLPLALDIPMTLHPDRRAAGPAIQARRQPLGVLTNRHVFLGAGHGWTFDSDNPTTGNAWFTQRPNSLGVVEDLGNVDQLALLAAAFWNAGATVIATRPVGFQNNEVVMDQSSAGVTFSGAWGDVPQTTGQWYFELPPSNPNQIFRTANASTTESAVARYSPTIPATGVYPVYTYVMYGPDRVNQLYRIRHAGGVTEVRVNHRRVGRGLVWLGSYTFNAGTSGWLEISNHKLADDPGTVVIADGIRFGNGMGDLNFGQGVSGFPRQDEASRYWAQATLGVDPPGTAFANSRTRVYDRGTSHSSDNVGTPPRTAAWMNNESQSSLTDRLYIGLHTNAAGGRGAVGLYNSINIASARTPNQVALAALLGREVNEDMQQLDIVLFPEFPRWGTRTTHTYTSPTIDYGEQRWDSLNFEMDGSITEIAFHDNESDAIYLRDGRARRVFAKSTVQAAIRYFNQFGGGPLEFPPDEPRNLRIVQDPTRSDGIILRWDAPSVLTSTKPGTPGPVLGGTPTGYALYVSTSGGDFELRNLLPTINSFPIQNLEPGTTVYAVVAARNARGESFPSNVAVGRVGAGVSSRVLLVDAFDKSAEPLSPLETTSGIPRRTNLGTYSRVHPRRANDFSYSMPHAQAMTSSMQNLSVDSVKKTSVLTDEVSLSDYDLVMWFTGKEGRDPVRSVSYLTVPFVTDPINLEIRTRLRAYVEAGGNLFLSGQDNIEVLDSNSPSGERLFFLASILRTRISTGVSTSLQIEGTPGDLFGGLSFSLGQGHDIYSPFSADVLNTTGGSRQLLRYVGGQGGGAAVFYDASAVARGNTLVLGFPFETISSPEQQALLMQAALQNLLPPPISADTWFIY